MTDDDGKRIVRLETEMHVHNQGKQPTKVLRQELRRVERAQQDKWKGAYMDLAQ